MNIDLDLNGRTAIVGGASRGIGAATARMLSSANARVILVARNEDDLQSVRQSLDGDGHLIVACDFDQPDIACDLIANALGGDPAHIVVNNTGGPPGGPIVAAEAEQFEQTFRRHVVTAQALAKMVVPGMKSDGYGRIINVISTSVYEPIPGLGVSNTIRGAMASWAKTMAFELGPDQITVNNVLPGFTDTGRLDAIISARAVDGKSEKQVATAMRGQVPLGRFARPEETAAMIGFLASPAAAYVSGQSIAVDGARMRSI